jgi:hypothetical protein
MKVNREEAFDLFRKFLSEGTLLECRFGLPIFSFRLRVRLREITPDGDLKLWSDDSTSELFLQVLSSAEFGYTEGKDLPGPDRFEGILVVILVPGRDDTISFAELPNR